MGIDVWLEDIPRSVDDDITANLIRTQRTPPAVSPSCLIRAGYNGNQRPFPPRVHDDQVFLVRGRLTPHDLLTVEGRTVTHDQETLHVIQQRRRNTSPADRQIPDIRTQQPLPVGVALGQTLVCTGGHPRRKVGGLTDVENANAGASVMTARYGIDTWRWGHQIRQLSSEIYLVVFGYRVSVPPQRGKTPLKVDRLTKLHVEHGVLPRPARAA